MKKQKPAPSIGSDFTFGPDSKVALQKFELSDSAGPVLKSKKTEPQKKNSTKNDVAVEEKAEEKVAEKKEEEILKEIKEPVDGSENETKVNFEERETESVDLEPAEGKQYYQAMIEQGASSEDALFDYCYKYNIFYDSQLVRHVLFSSEKALEQMPELYIKYLEADPKYSGLTFRSQLKRENFEKVYSEDLSLLSLSEDDKKNRQQIISIIGYDPFKEELSSDKPQLYRDLTGLLTDNLRKDITKQKAAIEIVKNYSTIAKYQNRVSDLLKAGEVDPETQETIDNLLAMIAKIQAIINATSKENGFSTGKTLGNGGRGMLSDVMNQVENQYYDDGITNFYDQATSKSIGEVAEISFRAQLNQVKLSGTDYADILSQQVEIVREAQKTVKDSLEALRICKGKITKQKLLEELEGEYRKKGISEEEIQEFISREYKLWDGK
ncbi:MAG: hypothetical protein SOX21_00285 [Candidatus Enterosoma sp.]|nr:hypothetical protein [Candidatus Enterosoma sp.]